MTQLDLDALNRLLWYFGAHRVITVAARAGILRRLAEASSSIEELSTELELHPLATGKVVKPLFGRRLKPDFLEHRFDPLIGPRYAVKSRTKR